MFTTSHRIDLHLHFDGSLSSAVQEVLAHLKTIEGQGVKIMATLADLQATIDGINTATNTVAAEVTALQGQINPGNISPEQADALNSQLQGIATRLQSIGSPATPTGNVPPTEPTPAPTA